LPAAPTCADCYFHRRDLCALPKQEPCPTFRHFRRGTLEIVPPAQAVLLPVPSQGRLAAGAA
jgi:hypothetical protein